MINTAVPAVCQYVYGDIRGSGLMVLCKYQVFGCMRNFLRCKF